MTRTRTWTPLLLGHLATVLAVLVAGVVGAAVLPQKDDEDVLQTISAVGASATAEKTFRSTFAFEVKGQGISISSTGEAVQDVERRLVAGSFTVPGAGRMELRQVGDVVYVRIPGKPAPGGQSWFAMTTPAGAAAVGGQDPLAMLKALSGSEEVDEVGTETVNGIATTHYEVDLDLTAIGELSAQNGGTSLPPGAADAIDEATADIWIDEQDLPRRMQMRLEGQGMDFLFSLDFLDYGKPVEVVAPPASDVLKVGSPAELGGLFSGSIRTG